MIGRLKDPCLCLLAILMWLCAAADGYASNWQPVEQHTMKDGTILKWQWADDDGALRIGDPLRDLSEDPNHLPAVATTPPRWRRTDFAIREGEESGMPYFYLIRTDSRTGKAWVIDDYRGNKLTTIPEPSGDPPLPSGPRGTYDFNIDPASLGPAVTGASGLVIERVNTSTNKKWFLDPAGRWVAVGTGIGPPRGNTSAPGTLRLTIRNHTKNPAVPVYWIKRPPLPGARVGPPTSNNPDETYTSLPAAGGSHLQDSFPGDEWEAEVNGDKVKFTMPNRDAVWDIPQKIDPVPGGGGGGLNGIGRPLTPLEQALLDAVKHLTHHPHHTPTVIYVTRPPIVKIYGNYWPAHQYHFGCPCVAPTYHYCCGI